LKHTFHKGILALLFLGIAAAEAQKPADNNFNPPRAPLPRYLEDYGKLDSMNRDQLYLKLKYLPAGSFGYFSFGGETRQRYEYFNNYRLGDAGQDPNGYLTSRYLLHADFHMKDWFRLFTQFSYTDVYGRAQGPRYPDRDRLAFHQLFVDLRYKVQETMLSLQVGRRECFFGKNRWMAYREGPNTRRSFDGINFRIQSNFQVDFFYLVPVDIGPGNLDNITLWEQRILGFHLGSRNWIPNNEMNFYGFFFQPSPSLALENHSDKKYALGFREKVKLSRFEADAEVMLQLAEPGDRVTRALMLGSEMRIRPFQAYRELMLGLDVLYTSGYTGGKNMTYQALYPSYMKSRNMDLFGKHNLSFVEPYIWWFPGGKNKLSLEMMYYLRSSTRDHVYSIPGFVLYDKDLFPNAYLGAQYSLLFTRYWSPFIFTELQYSRFQASEGLLSTGASHMDLFSLVLTIRF
jgi:hypothetical protein